MPTMGHKFKEEPTVALADAAGEQRDVKRVKSKADRHFVSALARGLSVLACFRSADKVLGNHEIARRCGLPKSTVSRLTYTLTRLGYLQYVEESAKYRLGTATLALGSAMLARMDVRKLARPLMQELADYSRSMVSLGVRERLSMIYIENCRSQSALTLSLDVGSRIPVATTAMGRACIAILDDADREELLAQIRANDEANWPKVRAGIDASIEQYRRYGCCCSFGDWQKDVNAIAVAFQPGDGSPPMSVSCGGPAIHLSSDFLLNDVRPRLVDLVKRLETSLGNSRD